LPVGRKPIRLEDTGLSAANQTALKRAVGGEVTFANLQQLIVGDRMQDPKLSALARFVDEGLRGTARKNVDFSANSQGVFDVRESNVLSTRAVKGVAGEPEELTKLRAAFAETGLWGQEQALEGFIRVAKDHLSPTRRQPALLCISGDVGHGKDQAIAQFQQTFLGEKATIHEVDLAGMTKNDVPALFDADGPLGNKTLTKLQAKGAVVVIKHADGIETNVPELAKELKMRLLAKRGEPLFKSLPWVFDFDTTGKAADLMRGALGKTGTAQLSGAAEFKHLDGPTMVRYFRALLPKLLEDEMMSDLTVEVDKTAIHTLGEALATPFAPIDELENRIHRLVLSHLDVHTSLDRRTSAVIIKTNPGYTDEMVQAELAGLHEEDVLVADHEELFTAMEVGKRVTSLEQREELQKHVETFTMSFPSARDGLFTDDLLAASTELTAQEEVFDLAVWEFSLSVGEVMIDVKERADLMLYDPIKPEEWRAIDTHRTALGTAIEKYETAGVPELEKLKEAGTIDEARLADLKDKLEQLKKAFAAISEGLAQLSNVTLAETPKPEAQGT
jgi:hypothetical protein